jgi:3-oxoacid CoA-transferase subunit A
MGTDISKFAASAAEAVADVPDGAVIAISGFCTAGVPRFLLEALLARGVRDLTLACGVGPLMAVPEITAELVRRRLLRKVIDSYTLKTSVSAGTDDPLEQAVRRGEVELEIYPMGTLAERYRAAGAGIPAFYTPTGAGTIVEEHILSSNPARRQPRETRDFDGRTHILEFALKPDYAFVRADTADTLGNLRYQKTGRNFGPVMARAAAVTVVEVENVVAPGEIPPDDVHTPGIYVQRVVQLPAPLCQPEYRF